MHQPRNLPVDLMNCIAFYALRLMIYEKRSAEALNPSPLGSGEADRKYRYLHGKFVPNCWIP